MSDVPAPRRRISLEDVVFYGLLGAMLVLYVAPLWAARYLPTLDLPSHLSLAAALHRLDETGTLQSQVYAARPGLSPYWTFYHLVSALAHLMPLLAALKVVLSLTALGLVGAFLVALRGFGRSRWLVFLMFPLLYDVNAAYGYVAYRMSIALALGCFGLLRRDLDEPRLWRELLLGALALLTYLTHAHGFVILGLLWALTVLVAVPLRLRPLVRALVPALPALALSAKWYLAALFAGPPGARVEAPTLPLIRLLELLPRRLLDVLSDGRDEFVFIAALLVWCGLVAASPRPEPPTELAARGGRLRWRLRAHLPELASGAMLILYFISPVQILSATQRLHGINYRFLIVICLLAALVPRLPLRRLGALAVAPALLLSFYFGWNTLDEYRAFDARIRPALDRVLAAIPPRKRVISFAYETHDPRFTIPVYPHLVGYYCALEDGVSSVDQTFTAFAYMPVKLKDERAHPVPPFPGPIDLRFFGARYDYILIIDRPGSRRAPFDPRERKLLVEAGPFRVYALH